MSSGMTIGRGARTITGVWVDSRRARRVLNVLLFGWHYQFVFTVSMDRWDRR